MRRFLLLTTVLAVALGLMASPASANGNGMTPVAGATDSSACEDGPGDWGAFDYAFHISGDLTGCIYGLVTDGRCHPSGMYQEVADEVFVADDDIGDDGVPDTFEMTEFFWAKFEFDETCDFETITAQVFGGCKHPIKAGTGTGAFEGVTGRLDFKDDVDLGVAFYKGHLRWS